MDMTRNVAKTLKTLFPDIAQIRREQLESGNEEHSFYIKQRKVSMSENLVHYQHRIYPFVLHYFPRRYQEGKSTLEIKQCEEMTEQLLVQFRYLDNYKAKIIRVEYEISNKVLLFHFAIQTRYKIEEPDGIPMRSLEERSNLRG